MFAKCPRWAPWNCCSYDDLRLWWLHKHNLIRLLTTTCVKKTKIMIGPQWRSVVYKNCEKTDTSCWWVHNLVAVAINVTDWCNLHKNIHDIDMIMWQKTHVLHLPTSNATSFRLHWMVSNHDSTRRDVIRIVFFCEHIGATNPWPRSCGNRKTASKCERAASKSLTDAHWDCGAGNNVTDYHTHACWCMWNTIFARLVQTIRNACCNHLHNHCLKCTARGQNRKAI